jgi:cysteinyl-tRNA synthetase
MKEELSQEEKATLQKADILRDKFNEAMEDDFNTADAIAAIFELVKLANVNSNTDNSREFITNMKDMIVSLCDIIGIIAKKEEEILPEEIERLIEERQVARKNKDFAKSDQIRDALLEKGIVLEDTREGVKWRRK